MAATLFAETQKLGTRAAIVPRDYQIEAHDGCFRDWENGQVGSLIRMATGLGKTLTACLIGDTWLQRSKDHRMMVVSYERQLVSQFAEEVEDYLGIKPGIEMDKEVAVPSDRIVVASRASLLQKPPPSPEQAIELASYGIIDLGACTGALAATYIRCLRKGSDVADVLDDLAKHNAKAEAQGQVYSRVHKFDWNLPWLLVMDEAHRHAYKLPSVKHLVDWFEKNPLHRRTGLTATPKRGDGVSIGDKMFPGIALDYPLWSQSGPCAVRDGWAVPYVQRYIEVEGVDFRNIKRISAEKGADFDEAELEKALGGEKQLAALVGPLLDMVKDRKTLIFSPGVSMAKNVALFINSRVEAKCECGSVKWYPVQLIGDGATCECGRFILPSQVTKSEQARQLDGNTPVKERKAIYYGHQNGKFQFLSVCGLCREGYNDPDVAAVACFRPVSRKASGLAEQIKGRSCRVDRETAKMLHTLPDAAARRKAIAESVKPDALIVDPVGITGLADCASTVAIYAEGLPDKIKDRAAEILAETALDQEVNVNDAIDQAKREDEEAKERIKQEREEAERRAKEEYEQRAKADAQARYTAHEVGYGSPKNNNDMTDKQLRAIERRGMELKDVLLTKWQAGRIIGMLKLRKPLEEVARLAGLKPDQWARKGPTIKQVDCLKWNRLPMAHSNYDASQIISAKKKPDEFVAEKTQEIASARTEDELTAVAKDIGLVRGVLPQAMFDRLVAAGKERRHLLSGHGDSWEQNT